MNSLFNTIQINNIYVCIFQIVYIIIVIINIIIIFYISILLSWPLHLGLPWTDSVRWICFKTHCSFTFYSKSISLLCWSWMPGGRPFQRNSPTPTVQLCEPHYLVLAAGLLEVALSCWTYLLLCLVLRHSRWNLHIGQCIFCIRICPSPIFQPRPVTSTSTSYRPLWSPASSSMVFHVSFSSLRSRSSLAWLFYPWPCEPHTLSHPF